MFLTGIFGKEAVLKRKEDDMGLLIFIGIVWIIVDLIKEACEPTIQAENWKNVPRFEVFNTDTKEFQKNLRNGKYK